ncbi:unnamed protein product [Clonostachys chloroleuca]|uniref:Ketoreductase (KR) domain-containing protein n=1 Tax=Clonostachys chloroleuca TaxID=1926264 RepID=A0AA35QDF5_9HYPO|nr:unnamed protein product [Clonostachys chloroleuca]
MEAAMRLVQLSGHMGKIFLVPAEQDLVKLAQLDENSTFLVAGNIDSIGSSIVHWIVERRAKNIVLCSCGVESHPTVLTRIQFAADKGCTILPATVTFPA